MLSILIPIYNYHVVEFIENLNSQCLAANVLYEIRIYDDASSNISIKKLNKIGIEKIPNTIYKELPNNIGRSAIRNLLADEAHFDYLLFMDGDSQIVKNDFIQKYINSSSPEYLIYGGTFYKNTPPFDHSLKLHWLAGHYREQTTASKRNLKPYKSFTTNNFLIPKHLFLKIRFNETLKIYGHEDTLFGIQLKSKNIPIHHIDNSLEHKGLETAEIFVSKQKKALQNLHLLMQHYPNIAIVTKIGRYYSFLKKWNLHHIIAWGFRSINTILYHNLISANPKLFYLDLYKLGYLCNI